MEQDPVLRQRLDAAIRAIPDFPKPGILFRDITPVLEDPALCRSVVEAMRASTAAQGVQAVVAIESRGFLFGMPLAIALGVPFITVRKKGKLPWRTVSYAYELEYGNAEVEMHVGSVTPGMRVLVHDDLLATGGTAMAAAELVRMQQGRVVGFSFLVELEALGGRERLAPYAADVQVMASY